MPKEKDEHLSMLTYFDKEQLNEIQQRLSKVTQMGFVTVNYRGESITERTRFAEICQVMRSDAKLQENCQKSDAMGCMQSAVIESPFIYLCPCGLLEIAIPIYVDDIYLGGFLCGQVHCPDLPKDIIRMKNFSDDTLFQDKIIQCGAMFRDIPEFPYDKICDISKMVELFISMLTENKRSQIEREAVMQKQIDLLEFLQEPILRIRNLIEDGQYERLRKTIPQITAYICKKIPTDLSHRLEAFRYMAENMQTYILPYEKSTILDNYPIEAADTNDILHMTFWMMRIMDVLYRENVLKQYRILENVFPYIDKNITEAISLDTIVRSCNISQGYLSRLFRESFGYSVTDYIHVRKIAEVKEYMYMSGCDAREASLRMGYQEVSYFSRVFKKYEGMTITEYKKTLKE